MNRKALEARWTMTMVRIVRPVDDSTSAELERRALDLARDAAWIHPASSPAPSVFDGEPALLAAFNVAMAEAEATFALIAALPPPVWADRWTLSFDGRWETRPCVARFEDGYRPGLFLSERGGNSKAEYGVAVASLEEAIGLARRIDFEWHVNWSRDSIGH